MVARHPSIKLLADKAQIALRTALSDGELRAGQFFSMAELSTLLDCPIASIRDAVKWASAHGLLEALPQRGIRVMDLQPKVMRECLDFGLMFDREGARRWLTRDTPDQLKQLRSKLEHLCQHPDSGENGIPFNKVGLQTDTEFHDFLARGLENSLLQKAYDANKLRLIVIKNAKPFPREIVLASMQEQLAVLYAMERDEEAQTIEELDKHFRETLRRWSVL